MGHFGYRTGADRERAQHHEAVFLQVPAMRRRLFLGRAGGNLLEAMRHLRLAAQLAGGRGLDPVISRQRFDERSITRIALEPDLCTRNAESEKSASWRVTFLRKNFYSMPPPAGLAGSPRGGSRGQFSASPGSTAPAFFSAPPAAGWS